jgi:hypothetical protein
VVRALQLSHDRSLPPTALLRDPRLKEDMMRDMKSIKAQLSRLT